MSALFREHFLGKKEFTIEGDIVFQDGVKRGRININTRKGVFGAVESDREPDLCIEHGLIFPGFVDLHVHAREDPSRDWIHKEDFAHAGKAALAGGLTGIADMPNTPEPLTDEAGYRQKYMLSRYSGIEVLLYAGIGPGTRPLAIDIPYKVFMGKSVGELFFTSGKELGNALERYRGKSVSFHCEDPVIIEEKKDEKTHCDRRPPEAEARAVELAIELIQEFELRGKLCHISTKEGMLQVERARKNGVKFKLLCKLRWQELKILPVVPKPGRISI